MCSRARKARILPSCRYENGEMKSKYQSAFMAFQPRADFIARLRERSRAAQVRGVRTWWSARNSYSDLPSPNPLPQAGEGFATAFDETIGQEILQTNWKSCQSMQDA